MNVVPLRPHIEPATESASVGTKPVEPPRGRWVCWRPEAALDGMEFLSPMEELAYRRILDWIFKSDDNLPDDDVALPRSTKTGRQWKAVKAALIAKGKIVVEGGRIRCPKATATCIERMTYVAQRRGAGRASHEARNHLKNQETPSTAVETPVPTDVPANSNLQKTEEEKKESPHSPPRKRGGRRAKKAPPAYTMEFNDFWEDFPLDRLDVKPKTFEEWNAALALGLTREQIMDTLDHYKTKVWPGKDVKFIKLSYNWLHSQPWENIGIKPSKPSSPQGDLLGGTT